MNFPEYGPMDEVGNLPNTQAKPVVTYCGLISLAERISALSFRLFVIFFPFLFTYFILFYFVLFYFISLLFWLYPSISRSVHPLFTSPRVQGRFRLPSES